MLYTNTDGRPKSKLIPSLLGEGLLSWDQDITQCPRYLAYVHVTSTLGSLAY